MNIMNTPSITAIICTHNRADYLGSAIDSLLAQACSNYGVLVVDNASTDSTAQVVQDRLETAAGKLRYVYEPTLGLSVARNRGSQETTTDILAYLDDDAEASPQWLSVLQRAYQENAQLAIAGGKVDLIWPPNTTPPAWLSLELMQPLGLMDLGPQPTFITDARLTPRGVNYSLRRSFLESVGGFDPNLGRVGKKLLSNEELYMTELALDQGWQVGYFPEALVHHHVAPERMHRTWFFRRSWWQGVSEYYRQKATGQPTLSQGLSVAEGMARGLAKAAKYWNRPDLRWENLIYAYGQLGYLWESFKGITEHHS
jgi:glycosyltransferase involved in cell wall biosynthesis